MEHYEVEIRERGNGRAEVWVGQNSLANSLSSIVIIVILVLIVAFFVNIGDKEETKAKYETELLNLWSDTNFESRKIGRASDKFGNQYEEALYFQYGYDSSWDKYALNGEYDSLSGTVFVPNDRIDHKNDKSGLKVMIYGDGKRLWSSNAMQSTSEPVEFEVDITGIQELEFRYNGGAMTWYRPIGIGNIHITRGKAAEGVTSAQHTQLPMRLLDLELAESTFVCRYTDRTLADRFGNVYEDAMLYTFGAETHKDVYLLDGNYEKLTGIVFVPTERRNSTDDWTSDEMYYVKLYGDGALLWCSSQMVDEALPEKFEIDVTGIRELGLSYYGGAITWDMEVAVANLYLQ